MGVSETLKLDSISSSFNWTTIGSWAALLFVFFVIFVITAVIIFMYYRKKSVNMQFRNKVPIFTSLNGKHKRVGVDSAKEVFIPDSNISLFYLRGKKVYIARPTRAMGEHEFWYSISENGEWVNFDLSVDTKDNTLAQANYDHRDTRYAYVNLKDIIKRNYKDKSVQWWKEYSHIITFIIVMIFGVGGIWVIVSKIGGLIDQLGPLTEQWTQISETMAGAVKDAQNINSGVA